jgi:PAS domain S-box-containing protein
LSESRSPVKILLVDDDEVDRMAVRRALAASDLRAELREADGVETALATLPDGFDCVLLDHRLPGGDGLEVIREARRRGIDTPMVMLTGQQDPRTVVELMKAGAADYLIKSEFTPEALGRSITNALRLHRAESQTRRAERALEASAERYRSLVEASAQAVWTTTAEGGRIAPSPAWQALTGQTEEELRGSGWLDAIHPEDRGRTAAAWEKAVQTRGDFDVEHRVSDAEGGYREMAARAVPVLDRTGAVREWVGTHTDLTEHKRVEAERERAVAARARFFAAMSHELRTPINAIIGYNELILDEIYGALNDKQRHGIERSQRAARHLLELVNDVLDLSKLEAGKLEMSPEEVHVPDLIQDLFVTVRPLADERGSALQLIHDDCTEAIITDPRRLRQILLNLFSNAFKFGQGNPVNVRCLQQEGDGVLIEVEDRGIGIAPPDQERIFEEFVQLLVTERTGTGLGLPISRRLAELLGGKLELASEPGSGSVFRLWLPRRMPQAATR